MNNKSMQALPIRFAKLLNVILIAAVFRILGSVFIGIKCQNRFI